MDLFALISVIITLAAAIGYLNSRYFKLPATIAFMSGSLTLSILLIIISRFGFAQFEHRVYLEFAKIDFHDLLMQGMLSFLLFAGALTINLNDLRQCKWEIGALATIGTIASTFLIGTLSYWLLPKLGFELSYVY